MATYYNGIEITTSRTISGVSLAGKSSFEFSGKTISLSIPPTTIRLYGDGVSWASSGDACAFGPSDRKSTTGYVYSSRGRYAIFQDEALLTYFSDGVFWTNDTTNIGGSPGSFWVEISNGLGGPIFDIC
jgi:hypothetical protein